jgi:hypothetical protein
MGHEAFVDVAYRGLEVGRRLRLREIGPRTAYVDVGTPMPVGAGLVIRTDDGLSIPAVVIRVHEQVAGNDMPPGMRIRTEELEGAAAGWWRELVSRADPEIPEPEQPASLALDLAPQAHDTAVMNLAAVADAVVEQAAPEQAASVQAEARADGPEARAEAGEGGNGASEDPHVLSASHTVVMSAVEISQITDLAGEESDGDSDANPDEAGEREAEGGNGAPGSNGDELQGGRGKRGKRRRRR